jgi:hypothetical protein
MKAENKHKLMVWGLVILAVMNVSTLGTILFHTLQTKQQEKNRLLRQPLIEVNTENFSGRFFRDKLNLDNEQMMRFREFNHEFRPLAFELTQNLSKLRGEMLNEMEQPKPDTALLNKLAKEIGNTHAELKIISYQYYLNIKSLCNPDQQIILKELFGKLFQSDAKISFPGREGKTGMGRGRMNRE